MVAFSKLFETPMCYLKCSDIYVHPGKGCIQNIIDTVYEHHIGTGKYFLPLLLMPIVFKIKNLNWEVFAKSFKFYAQLVSCSSIITTLIYAFICMFRALCGKFTKYTTILAPTYIASQLCWILPKSSMNAHYLAMQQAFFETFLRKYPNTLSHLLINSRAVQTILFMLSSAIIMHYKRGNIYNGFWFIQPNEQKPIQAAVRSENNDLQTSFTCVHANQTCLKYLLNGIRFYMPFGLVQDIYGMLMRAPVKNVKGVRLICRHYLKSFRPKMTGFFLTYISVYRFSTCILGKYLKTMSDEKQHMLAALLAGVSHVFLDKITFLTLALVILRQVLWQKICTFKTDSRLLTLIQRLPLQNISYPFLMTQMMHDFFSHNDKMSKITRDAVSAITSGRATESFRFITKHSVEEIMQLSYPK